LDTGLSHQIRVQLSHIGHPIVGDIKYNATQPLPQKNIALMATNIAFQHPTTKEKISLEIPI
jgi:23S rRNA pseudouridine1911/1915/1917 synthase